MGLAKARAFGICDHVFGWWLCKDGASLSSHESQQSARCSCIIMQVRGQAGSIGQAHSNARGSALEKPLGQAQTEVQAIDVASFH